MCDLKPGDEVVLYRYMEDGGHPSLPPIGHVGTITLIGRSRDGGPEVGLQLDNWDLGRTGGMNVLMFRKVAPRTDKRDLTEWLAQPTEVEEPKRAPAKKRERVE